MQVERPIGRTRALEDALGGLFRCARLGWEGFSGLF